MAVSNRVLIVFPGKQAEGNGWGGVFNASVAHIKALKAADAEVVVWTASKPIADAAKQAGAEVGYDPIWHRGLDPLFAMRCWRKARALKRKGLLGALHEGGRTGLWGRLLFLGIPQAGVMHRERIESYRTFKDLLVLSKGYKKQLEASCTAQGRRIAVAPNALKLESSQLNQITTPASKNPIPVIGFMGRMEPVKGIDLLIEAAARLKDKGMDFRMEIAGGNGGAYVDTVNVKGLGNIVTFPGWNDHPEERYATWDIFCLPSRNEPFGLSLIEAMAIGLPAIATRCNGPSDIIEDGVSGFLIPIENSDALANKLAQLIEDSELREKMGLAARERILKNYSLEAVGNKIIHAVSELNSTKHKRR